MRANVDILIKFHHLLQLHLQWLSVKLLPSQPVESKLDHQESLEHDLQQYDHVHQLDFDSGLGIFCRSCILKVKQAILKKTKQYVKETLLISILVLSGKGSNEGTQQSSKKSWHSVEVVNPTSVVNFNSITKKWLQSQIYNFFAFI